MLPRIQFPKLFSYQQAALSDPHNLKVLDWGAQAGKTRFSLYTQAAYVLSAGKEQSLWVTRDGKFAREEHRLAYHLMPREYVAENNRSDGFIKLKNGHKWWFYSGIEPDAFRGRSWHSVVFNEASTYSETGWKEVVLPRLRGWAIFNFTPKGKRNWTFELWNQAGEKPDDWFRSQVATTSNPTIDTSQIELIRRTSSEAYYQQEILAEFVSDSGQYFNPNPKCWTGRFEAHEKKARYAAGLDWAETRDYTALAILRIDVLPRRLVYFARFPHMEYTAQITPLVAKLKEYGNPPCLADKSNTTANQLMRQAGTNVEDFSFSSQSKPFICDQLRVVLEQAEVTLPVEENGVTREERLQCQWLRDEIAYFEPHFVGGKLKLGARGQHHDDILMALAMANERARLVAPLHDDEPLAYLSTSGRGKRF